MLTEIQEKPGMTFWSMQVVSLETEYFEIHTKETYFDMTDLIKETKLKGFKIGVFPVSEKSWIDV